MVFLESAQNHLQTLKPGSADHLILQFLLNNAIGRYNAQPWPTIERHLRQHGFKTSKNTFQQGLLKQSRTGDFFIGSNDHEPCVGYFIIKDKEDAELMQKWYKNRLKIEEGHLKHLEQLMAQKWH